jgi:CheY-like chemotaxis protein
MRILVIDDEPPVCLVVRGLLNKLGHSVEIAGGGAEALEKFQQQPFDLVFTDLGMPGMNGYEVAERLRQMAPRTTIILLTGWPVQLGREELNSMGIAGVVNKPVTLQDLRAAIVSFVPTEAE